MQSLRFRQGDVLLLLNSPIGNAYGLKLLSGGVLESLLNEQVLQEYKAQQSPERGFRFLKDPLFFTNSVFLKSPERIAALAFVMGLCLLVYNLGQRQLRHDESRDGDEPSQPTWSSDSASYLTLGVSVFPGCASVAG